MDKSLLIVSLVLLFLSAAIFRLIIDVVRVGERVERLNRLLSMSVLMNADEWRHLLEGKQKK